MKYSKQLLNLFHNPQHGGELPDAKILSAGQQEHGDAIKLFIQLKDDVIDAVTFKAYGSVVTLAMAEYVCQWLLGKTVSQAKALTAAELLVDLQLSSLYIHKAQLFTQALVTL